MRYRKKQDSGRRERVREELERYGREVLDSEEMRRAFTQKHHTLSTVGEHTMRVAEKSLKMCHALRRLHIQTDVPAVVRGSLCHDLGILGRDEKYATAGECARQHPADSVEVAESCSEICPGRRAISFPATCGPSEGESRQTLWRRRSSPPRTSLPPSKILLRAMKKNAPAFRASCMRS